MARYLAHFALAVCSLTVGWRAAAEENLESKVNAVLDQPRYKEAHWGVLFVDAKSGETLFSRNESKLFAPASVTKCFTVAAAMDGLGVDYRFETPVVKRGDVDREGTLAGDLILIASGDLTLGGRTTEASEIEFTNGDHTYALFAEDSSLTAA